MAEQPVAERPDGTLPDETVVYVCTTCRAADDPPDGPRGGARLLAALLAEAARAPRPGLRVEGVECLSVCKRPCTVALAAPGRWTYVYGDLDPAIAAPVILDGVGLYAGTADGLVPWRERPKEFRQGVVARIPPFPGPPPAAPPTPDAA